MNEYDVSKAQLDFCCLPVYYMRLGRHDPSGIKELVQRLTALQPTLIVLESTGGWEPEVLCALASAGLAVAQANRPVGYD